MDARIRRLIDLDNRREASGLTRNWSTGKPHPMFGDPKVKLQWFRFLDLEGGREMTQAEKVRLDS